jgi:diacylglycerol kinase family enzyme
LGILRFGTANVLARELRLPLKAEDDCERILTGTHSRMDVGVVTDEEGTERRFTCMAGIGFDVNVIREVTPRLKRYLKSLAFPLAALKVYFRDRRPTLHIVDDDTSYVTQFAVVANGQYYGGEFEIAEDASLRSGKLEVVLIENVSLILRPDILARILAKSPLDRAMKSFPSQGILATSPGTPVPVQLDGEVWGRLPMSFRSEPAAIKVVR